MQALYNSIQVIKEARILNSLSAQERGDIEREIEGERRDWKARKKQASQTFMDKLRQHQGSSAYINVISQPLFPTEVPPSKSRNLGFRHQLATSIQGKLDKANNGTPVSLVVLNRNRDFMINHLITTRGAPKDSRAASNTKMMRDLNHKGLQRIKETLLSEDRSEHQAALRRDYTSRSAYASAAVYGYRCLKPKSRAKMRADFEPRLEVKARNEEVGRYLDDLIGV